MPKMRFHQLYKTRISNTFLHGTSREIVSWILLINKKCVPGTCR